ncbi:DoxX family protein [Sphingobacterium gobiense]|uniref:DoxX family protein n=1 Tax=Sphingobacterium gobiense TaxID=1382456 RepID=A0A2S9JV27_9SPHI|nr:hypothetical protein [Sphingobacterium gobiense]PRD57142.1 hypothetical protein C5749_08040 [Sphingobacterium gobiense]
MKPLFVLIGVWLISILVIKLWKSELDYKLSGKIALSVMLLFTALGHFIYAEGMSKMLPHFIPFSMQIIYATAFIEIIAAICIFIPPLRYITGVLLVFFFLAVLPANIFAAVTHLNYETGKYDGPGVDYLWFRIPFQLLLICWTYLSVIK